MSENFLKKFKEKWEIIEMDLWDVEPGWFIEFDGKGQGSFQFIYIDADIDHRMSDDLHSKKTEFTFHGSDEGNEIFGRGWAKIDGAILSGFLCFHQGDESGFKAKIMKTKK